MGTPAPPVSDIKWLYPSLFKIYKTSTSDREPAIHVFANGQQRAEIKVDVELVAADGRTVVPISATELKKLVRLVTYGEVADAYCIPVDDERVGLTTWSSSFSSNEYTWNEEFIKRTLPAFSEPPLFPHDAAFESMPRQDATAPPADDDVPRERNTLKFFVSGASVTNLKIAARLKTLDANPLTFHTGTSHADDPEGRGQNGAFNSSVVLHGVRPYTPSVNSKEFGEKDGNGSNRLRRKLVKSSAPMHFYEQWITLEFLGESIKPLKAAMGDEPQLWRDGGRADGLQWSIFFLTPPNARTYSISGDYELRDRGVSSKGTVKSLVDTLTGGVIENATPYRVVIGQLSGTDDWRITDKNGKSPGDVLKTLLSITDEFGNEHGLSVSEDDLAWCKIDDARKRKNPDVPDKVPDDHDYLVSPKIAVYQDRVYGNARQTATIEIGFTVEVTAIDKEGKLKKIKRKPRQHELNSVRLFDYKYASPLAFDEDVVESGWSSTMVPRPFDIHPDAKPTGTPPLDDEIGYIRFYVSGGPDTANQVVDLGFMATIGDYTFWTNGNIYDRSGTFVVKDEGIDTRPGHTVASLPPVVYPSDRFQFNDKPRDDAVFDQELEVSININRPDPLGIYSATCTPTGLIHWDLPGSASRNPCFIGYVPPNEEEVHHDAIISSTFQKYGLAIKSRIDYPRPHRLVIVLGGRMGIGIDNFDTSNPPPMGSAKLTMIDMHGSIQVRNIMFVPNFRNNLIIV